ncbi:MAG: 2-polyprenyl-3-methyl-6-methoxy-1,4-benzoquinone monooxygenase [Pseudomonadota bacterium]
MSQRKLSLLDRILCEADAARRGMTRLTEQPRRPSPAEGHAEADLSEQERRHAAGLMRVNHTGEVCAQALYRGQALTARLDNVRSEMDQAAVEEADHLAWCEQRLEDLDSHPSALNPVFYGMSFALGAIAGTVGDEVSLGFVAATEERVCAHLRDHLQRLPETDRRSRLVLQQMLEDEERHGDNARAAGGRELPSTIKSAMTSVSKLMTETTYHV